MEELNIRHFKLLNGDDIIGLVAVKNDDNYIIERPVIVQTNLLGGYHFTPWFPFSDSKQFKIMKSNIIQHVSIAEEAKDAYIQFALRMNKLKTPEYKSDLDIIAEMEEAIEPREDESSGKTIH